MKLTQRRMRHNWDRIRNPTCFFFFKEEGDDGNDCVDDDELNEFTISLLASVMGQSMKNKLIAKMLQEIKVPFQRSKRRHQLPYPMMTSWDMQPKSVKVVSDVVFSRWRSLKVTCERTFHLAVVSTHDSLTECFNLPCVCYSGYLSMLLLFLMSLLLPFVFRLDLERSMLIWLRIIIMYTNTITLWTVVYEVICERLFSRILH